MKLARIFPLVLALLLSGCGARRVADEPSPSVDTVSASPSPAPTLPPTPTPPVKAQVPADGIPLECTALEGKAVAFVLAELPSEILSLNAILSEAMEGQPFLIAQLPEDDIYLYGTLSPDDESNVILRVGDRLAAYPLTWTTNHGVFPALYLLDLDGDGEEELLIVANTNSGTQCNVWTPTVVELSQENWPAYTLEHIDYAAAVSPYLISYWEQFPSEICIELNDTVLSLSLPESAMPENQEDSPFSLSPGIGDLCVYMVESCAVRADFAVAPHCQAPWATWIAAELFATLQYRDGGFSLIEPVLIQAPT